MAKTKKTTLETEILREETRKAVRKANQRLAYMQKTGYETNAVKIALHQIELTRKEDKNATFRVNKNMSFNQLEHEFKIANAFLNSKGSTVKGMKDTIARRDETFLKKDENLKPQTLTKLYDILNSAEFKKVGEMYGSNQVLNTVLSVKGQEQNFDVMTERLQKVIDSVTGKSSDEMYLDDLKEYLKGNEVSKRTGTTKRKRTRKEV